MADWKQQDTNTTNLWERMLNNMLIKVMSFILLAIFGLSILSVMLGGMQQNNIIIDELAKFPFVPIGIIGLSLFVILGMACGIFIRDFYK